MVIVQPPCHPNEPLKVPEDATERVHCMILRYAIRCITKEPLTRCDAQLRGLCPPG